MAKRAGAPPSPDVIKKSKSEAAEDRDGGRVLEKGLIYFFYRPKLDVSTAKDIQDVHHLYIVLAPGIEETTDVESTSHKKRLLIIEHNRLPQITSEGLPRARSVAWCHVDTVSHHFVKISQALHAETIGTMKDDKMHVVEPARAVAQGFYALVELDGHVHLTYALDEPKSIGTVQEAFHIDQEVSYIVTVRNPISSRPRIEGSAKSFPPYLIERFEVPGKQPREWIPLLPTDFLDHEGVELCLAGAAKGVQLDLGALGIDLRKMDEKSGKAVLHDALMKELHLSAKGKRVLPLKTGEWA